MTLTVTFRTRRSATTAAERSSILRHFERALPGSGIELAVIHSASNPGVFIEGRSSHNTFVASKAHEALADLLFAAPARQ